MQHCNGNDNSSRIYERCDNNVLLPFKCNLIAFTELWSIWKILCASACNQGEFGAESIAFSKIYYSHAFEKWQKGEHYDYHQLEFRTNFRHCDMYWPPHTAYST